MNARAEMSITPQEAEPELSESSGMSVALIGPNSTHRRIVAKALAGSVANHVREFIDYPGPFSDLPRMVGEGFDAVIIDVDSDYSYALALIEKIAAVGKARVVAYSIRSNPDLEASCLQAGAHDFLPLPADNDEETGPVSPTGVEDAGESGSADLRPFEEQSAPEKIIETEITDAKAGEASSSLPGSNGRKREPVAYDFTDWDARFLRPVQPAVVEAPDAKPQPILARKRSKRYALRITPFESHPPVDEARPSAIESHPGVVENNPPEVESSPAAVESHQPEDESRPAAVESHPAIVEIDPPDVENRLAEVASVLPVEESVPPEVESGAPAVDAAQPVVESVAPVVESAHAVVESTAPAVDSVPPVVKSIAPKVESVVHAVDSVPPAVETIIPAVKSIAPAAESVVPVVHAAPPAVKTIVPAAKSVAPEAKSVVSSVNAAPPAVKTIVPAAKSVAPEAKSVVSAVNAAPPAVQRIVPSAKSVAPEAKSVAPEVQRGPHSMARTLVPINWSDDEPFPFDEEEPPVASRKDEPRQDRQRDALFVASQYKAQALEDEADEDEELHPSWMKLVYIAAGLGLVAGLLVIFAGPPVRRALQTASFQAENIAYQMDTPHLTPAVKRSTPRSWKTILDGSFGNAVEPRPAEQVSPDLMMAQLTAPSRIPVAAKRPAPFEAPPPGLAPAAIEVGSSVPGILFSGQNKVTVVPGVSAISAGVAEGLLIHRTAPVYPMFARENNLSGTVFLSATITKTGAINSLRVLSGPSVFRDAAVNAVKTWRYKPYMLDKQPVDVQTTISVVFKAREN